MERKRAKTFACAILALSQTFFAGPVTSSARETNHSDCWKRKATERAFVRRINRARERNGLSPLRADPELGKASRSHTHGMAKQSRLYHTPGDRLGRKVTNWTTLGENVGVGGNVAELHRAFMRSQGHRDNVLYSAYRFVGVGVVSRADRMWVTVTFESRSDPGTTQRMPRC
jgi:uncharacterized protein YkwD